MIFKNGMFDCDLVFKTFGLYRNRISSHRDIFNDDEMDEIELHYGNAFSKYEARG